MKIMFTILLIFLYNFIFSQNDFFNPNIIQSNIVYGDTLIKLFNSDKIKIKGTICEKGGLKIKLTTSESDSLGVITISLTKENFGSDKGIMLKITNPFDRNMTYKALIGPTKSGKFVVTSVIPVKSNLMAIETWPYVFSSIILYDFKLE
jgi:hypothetical protein